MSVPAHKHIWRALPILAAICFAYATVLVKLSRDWWTDENYSHGLLIPFIIGYILWSQRDKLASRSSRPSFLWGGAAVAIALFALWVGVAGAELYIQRLSLILLLAGTVVCFALCCLVDERAGDSCTSAGKRNRIETPQFLWN